MHNGVAWLQPKLARSTGTFQRPYNRCERTEFMTSVVLIRLYIILLAPFIIVLITSCVGHVARSEVHEINTERGGRRCVEGEAEALHRSGAA